jgi:hypothetical protein
MKRLELRSPSSKRGSQATERLASGTASDLADQLMRSVTAADDAHAMGEHVSQILEGDR